MQLYCLNVIALDNKTSHFSESFWGGILFLMQLNLYGVLILYAVFGKRDVLKKLVLFNYAKINK